LVISVLRTGFSVDQSPTNTPIADRVFNDTSVGKGSYKAKYVNSASGLGTSVSYRF
jgi:hypothetical protein